MLHRLHQIIMEQVLNAGEYDFDDYFHSYSTDESGKTTFIIGGFMKWDSFCDGKLQRLIFLCAAGQIVVSFKFDSRETLLIDIGDDEKEHLTYITIEMSRGENMPTFEEITDDYRRWSRSHG